MVRTSLSRRVTLSQTGQWNMSDFALQVLVGVAMHQAWRPGTLHAPPLKGRYLNEPQTIEVVIVLFSQ